jgi:nicotinamidase-related amidase
MKVLVVVDMQNDFIDGSLGTKEAQAIVPNVKKKIEEYRANGWLVWFTRDTHGEDYLETNEGKKLPVEHCIAGTKGWNIADGLYDPIQEDQVINKLTFGSFSLVDRLVDDFAWHMENDLTIDEIEVVGLCTDICVVSNALMLKAAFYDCCEISVDATCCAGVTPESHEAALKTMEMCQINVKRETQCL